MFMGRIRSSSTEHDYGDLFHYRATFARVMTDTFRLVIRASANPAYPNAAQISRIELYPPV